MNWTLIYFTCFIVIIIDLKWTAAQLSDRETLVNITECDPNVDLDVVCTANEMIAIHSLQYAFDDRCTGICCTYSSTDCLQHADVTDIQAFRRACSGQSSCTVLHSLIPDQISFGSCSLPVKDISYVLLQYYCIPKNRITSICSSGVSLTSDDAPLYLTNQNYPSVTTGSVSCSCSLEVYSCSSSINLYTIDADLYLDTSTCDQNIQFLDGSEQSLHTIGCESHYKDQIESNTASSHYTKIDFINNSTQNQEGYFFIGLEASESGVSFNLSCNYEQETWCIGCGDVPTITNGNIELNNANDSSYDAQANVVCDSGYETATPTISCLGNGTWPSTACTEKAACTVNQWRCSNGDCIADILRCDSVPDDCADSSDEQNCNAAICPEGLKSCPQANGTTVCVDKAADCSCGSVPSIGNGVITTDNSTIGSVGNVTCNEGYDPSKETVTCLTSGSWETAACIAKDCGTLQNPNFGQYILSDINSTTFGATASVECIIGYASDKPVVTCQSSGIWESAVCTIRDCGTLQNPNFGQYKLADISNTTYGATASVECITGYAANKPNVTCQSSGIWESAVCTIRDCGTLQNPNFGQYKLSDVSNTTYGATASVECLTGYAANKPNVTCQTSGIWESAVCTIRDCGTLQNPNFGQYKLADISNTTYGTSASVECITGYAANKPNVTCQSSGIWESAVCTIRVCGTLQNPNFGQYKLADISNTTYGATASVECITGYAANKPNVTCQSSGIWESAVCTIRDCGTVPSVDHGNVILNANNRTTFGGAASVTCDDGYEPKSVTIICQSSGAWQTPLCEIKDKTTPAAVATSQKKSSVDIILVIIIAVLGTLFLIQLLVMCYFQCKIHGIRNKAEGGDKKVPKRIGMTLLGSVPVLGLIPIYMTGKVFYRDVYQVTHKHPIKESSGVPSKSLSNKTYSDASWNTTETLSHEVDADHIELEHQKTNSTLESPSSNEHDGNVITNADHNQLEPQVTGAITETKTDTGKQNSTLASPSSNEHDGSLPGSHESSRSTMTRGISAVAVADKDDDMALDRKPQHSLKPKLLPPIGQHVGENHHASHYHPVHNESHQHQDHHDSHHHHFPKDVEKRREKLRPIMDQARREGKHADLVQDKLYINNRLYHPEDHNIPLHTQPTHNSTFY